MSHIEAEILITHPQIEPDFVQRYQKVRYALMQIQSFESSHLRYTDSIIELMIELKEPMHQLTEEQREKLREGLRVGQEESDAYFERIHAEEMEEMKQILE